MARKTQNSHGAVQQEIFRSYLYLRAGLGFLALAFPLILGPIGDWLFHTHPQGSLSAYYHTDLRNVFVGVLFVNGFFLFLYRGFSSRENWTLNIAAVSAVCIALLPTEADSSVPCAGFTAGTWHGISAICFFIAIGIVCIFFSKHTLYLFDYPPNNPPNKPAAKKKIAYAWTYNVLGILMIIAPVAAWILFAFVHAYEPSGTNRVIYGVEFAGVWVFALYWLCKTMELRDTNADQKFVPKALRPIT